jgi:hypothetical protein
VDIEEPFNIHVEQSHVDLIALEIDRFFERLPEVLNSVDHAGQIAQYESIAKQYERSKPSPYHGVFDTTPETGDQSGLARVGRHTVHSESKDILVWHWESDAAKKYIQLEREDNGIYHAAVEIRDGIVISVTETNAERAFRRRQRILQAKGERLHDIVDVIRPEQDDIVRLDGSGGLVIQGGPGTGKTVVALQRLAYLLHVENKGGHTTRPVLIVGPTKSYVDYVHDFLPGLGHQNATNVDIQTLCLLRLTEREKFKLQGLRDERDGITISKNTPQITRLIRGLIWDPGIPTSVSATVAQPRRAPEVRHVTSEFIQQKLMQIGARFNDDQISYNQARMDLQAEVVRRLLSGSPTDGKLPGVRSLEGRRDSLLENWLLKIGLHSQLERQRWRQVIDTPSGGRYKRGLSAIMSDFYMSDIELAIEAIAEKATLDPKVLREELEQQGAPLKRGANDEPADVLDIPEEVVVDLGEISLDQSVSALASGRMAGLDKVINALLPSRSVLSLAEAICCGDEKMFDRVLGPQSRELAARFAKDAMNRPQTSDYWWTNADLPIIAEISYLVDGNSQSQDFFHVVIDEAQDLTVMQARAIGRYISNGQVTVAGDVNQATRPSSIGDWDKFFSELGIQDWDIRTLDHNYRVPENIYDYALMYLDEEERIETPSCDLEGGKVVLDERDPVDAAVLLSTHVHELSSQGERVAVITDQPEEVLKHLVLPHENTVVLTAEDCKGLEVDHTVVWLPARWFNSTERMRKLMYVVLTRATKSVSIFQPGAERFGIFYPQVDS